MDLCDTHRDCAPGFRAQSTLDLVRANPARSPERTSRLPIVARRSYGSTTLGRRLIRTEITCPNAFLTIPPEASSRSAPLIDEPEQRVVTEGLFPRSGGVFLLQLAVSSVASRSSTTCPILGRCPGPVHTRSRRRWGIPPTSPRVTTRRPPEATHGNSRHRGNHRAGMRDTSQRALTGARPRESRIRQEEMPEGQLGAETSGSLPAQDGNR